MKYFLVEVLSRGKRRISDSLDSHRIPIGFLGFPWDSLDFHGFGIPMILISYIYFLFSKTHIVSPSLYCAQRSSDIRLFSEEKQRCVH